MAVGVPTAMAWTRLHLVDTRDAESSDSTLVHVYKLGSHDVARLHLAELRVTKVY